MKIKHILSLFLTVELALASMAAVLAYRLGSALVEAHQAQESRFQSFLLADELRQSSDDLTRFARTYAVTGDERFERYFRQVLAIRDGALPRPEGYEGVYWDLVAAGRGDEPGGGRGTIAALETRMTEAGFTGEELEKLKEAQALSDQLVRLEDTAMNAVEGRFADGAGGFSRRGEPDLRLAADLLHGDSYHSAKAAIMQPIGDFQLMVDQRTRGQLAVINARVSRLQRGIFLSAGAMLICLALMVWTIQRRVTRRTEALVGAAGRIAEGDLDVRSGVAGSDELGILGRTFDSMVEQLSGALSQARTDTREAESRVEAIFDNATDGILVLSGEGHSIEAANPAAAGMLGATSSQLVAAPLDRFVSPAVPPEEGAAGDVWIEAIRAREGFTEVVGRRADGTTFPAELVVRAARVEGRGVLVATLRDVSQWKHLIDERTAEIGRLSTPVIEVWKGVLLLPLIGTLDPKRARSVVEAVLAQIEDRGAERFILDISGVASVDAEVAGHLVKIARATRLMGCDLTISGLSPEAAQTLVELGIRLGDIRTTSTLRAALELALHPEARRHRPGE